MSITHATRCAITLGALALLGASPSLGGVPVTVIGQWDGFGGTYGDVWGDGDFAYIGHFGDSAVNIVDISDPTTPIAIEYVLPPPNTSASAQDLKTGDGLLFIGLGGGGASVHIVDVRDPANPVGLVDIDISGFTSIHNVFYDNGWLYMVDSGNPRIGIIDLTGFDPDNPPGSPITSAAWIMEDVGTSFVHDIVVVDGRLYASAWDSGLWIYDVSNVANESPPFLGRTPDGDGDNSHSAWPTGNGDYVVTNEERGGGGIKVYRITEAENGGSLVLTLTDSLEDVPDSFSAHNPLIIGYRVYNSWYEAGLLVFNIDPITGLLETHATFDNGGSVWGVYPFLGEDRVLLSNMTNGLLIVSLCSEPPAGDLDGDCMVGITDFLMLLSVWGPCDEPCPPSCPADLDGDCMVGITDFLMLLANWG